MKYINQIFSSILLFAIFNTAFADNAHMGHEHHHLASKVSFNLTVASSAPIEAGKPTTVTLYLTDKTSNKPVTYADLKTVHTQKVHALIIDPTMMDYQHMHPVPGKKPGEYTFTFTPTTSNPYRIWLDLTPNNGQQQYVIADLPGTHNQNLKPDKILSTSSEVDGYHFELSFDQQPLKVNESYTGSLMITDKEGKPVTQLEPIMEAFAHIVAFNQDYKTILHIHPMGAEPKDPKLRGGPKIDFHIMPTQPGYIKLFAQVKINGKEIFAPFGIEVKP